MTKAEWLVIKITDENDNEVARSAWVGTPPTDDDDYLLVIGEAGYYCPWQYD